MAAWKAGDESAFDELFRRHAPLLLRLMQRDLGDREEARNLVQQTFLQLHRSRSDFRDGERLRPWLITIALNLKREHFRRTRRRPTVPLEDEAGPPVDAVGARRQEARRDLLRALSRLPPEQREVILLHWMEGLSFAEVAACVGATTTAVKVRAHRGYVAMRGLLGAAAGNPRRDPDIGEDP